MTDCHPRQPSSAFIARWAARLGAAAPRGARALDVASGRGRHALVLADAGFHVTAVDIQLDGLVLTMRAARQRQRRVSALCADLTTFPLPQARYAVVVVTRYLDRGLFPAIHEALADDGVLLYETFTERQLQHGRGPRSAGHLLRPGELRQLVSGMDVLFDQEVVEPDAVARIAARRRPRPAATFR